MQEYYEKFIANHQRILELATANATLAYYKLLSVMVTQPLHVIMRYQQAMLDCLEQPRVLSIKQAYREILQGKPKNVLSKAEISVMFKKILETAKINPYKNLLSKSDVFAVLQLFQEMIKGSPYLSFYKGTIPGLSKEFWKNISYKGALIKGAPDLAKQLLFSAGIDPSRYDAMSPLQRHLFLALIAGAISGHSDAILSICFENHATFLSTAQGKYANASFMEELKKEKTLYGKLARLSRGLGPTIAKSNVAFVTFFAVTKPMQVYIDEFFSLPPGQKTWYSLLTASLLSGFVVALLSSPFDIVKTNAQKAGADTSAAAGTDVKTNASSASVELKSEINTNASAASASIESKPGLNINAANQSLFKQSFAARRAAFVDDLGKRLPEQYQGLGRIAQRFGFSASASIESKPGLNINAANQSLFKPSFAVRKAAFVDDLGKRLPEQYQGLVRIVQRFGFSALATGVPAKLILGAIGWGLAAYLVTHEEASKRPVEDEVRARVSPRGFYY
jgi:hypothetical protein